MVEAELSTDETAPASENAAARRSIADIALRLAETGVVRLPNDTAGEAAEQ